MGAKSKSKSKSKSQRHLMGYAYSIKKAGKKSEKYKEASQSVKDIADSMTLDQLKDFASTKEKGLPKKVKKKKKKASKTNETKHIKTFESFDINESVKNKIDEGRKRIKPRSLKEKNPILFNILNSGSFNRSFFIGELYGLEDNGKPSNNNNSKFFNKLKGERLHFNNDEIKKLIESFEKLSFVTYKECQKAKQVLEIDNKFEDQEMYNFFNKSENNLNESYERDVVFQHKHRKNVSIILKLEGSRIKEIQNETNFRFPYKIGQPYNMGLETWACNNQFTLDGRDTCPKKKIFGINVDDVPQGHEWRHIYPNKFRN